MFAHWDTLSIHWGCFKSYLDSAKNSYEDHVTCGTKDGFL